MAYHLHLYLAMGNALVCGAIVWACLCRLNTAHAHQYKSVRARYALLLTAAMSSGLQPILWASWPTVADVGFSACVLVWLTLHVRARAHPMRRQEDA